MYEKKLISIIGARPQFVKVAVVSAALAHSDSIEEQIVHTGQHYDNSISGLFFDELNIPQPIINLNVSSDSPGKQTGKILSELDDFFIAEQPELVMVYGDTNSTLAGALAAAKMYIPIAHVEAGMRSFNSKMPEEINRILTDHLAAIHFCSTDEATSNLNKEGITTQIHPVGDVMYECFERFSTIASERWKSQTEIQLPDSKFILLTLHRAENTDNNRALRALWSGISEIAAHNPIVFPINPRTLKALKINNLSIPKGLYLINPVSYLAMIQLEKKAAVIITDSGGVQKEAYFARTPCITIREETEWNELVACGWNKLVGTNKTLLCSAVEETLSGTPPHYPGILYGDGKTSDKIVKILEDNINNPSD